MNCPYDSHQREGELALDLAEVCRFTYQNFLSGQAKSDEETAQEYGVTAVAFHPAFDLFGLQHSVMIGAASIQETV